MNEIKAKLTFYEIADNDFTGIIAAIYVNGIGTHYFSNFSAEKYYPILEQGEIREQLIWENQESLFTFPTLDIAINVITSSGDFKSICLDELKKWNVNDLLHFNTELESVS